MHFLYRERWDNALRTPPFLLLNKQQSRELELWNCCCWGYSQRHLPHKFKSWQQRARAVKLKMPDSRLAANCKVKTATWLTALNVGELCCVASSSGAADFQVMTPEMPMGYSSSFSTSFDTHEKRQAGGCLAAFLLPPSPRTQRWIYQPKRKVKSIFTAFADLKIPQLFLMPLFNGFISMLCWHYSRVSDALHCTKS